MIVLGDQGYEAAFGKSSTAPYLSKTLAGKGELLENYYAVTQGDLANEIALLSGQGPTPQTAAGCPEYAQDVGPRRRSARSPNWSKATAASIRRDRDPARPARRRPARPGRSTSRRTPR